MVGEDGLLVADETLHMLEKIELNSTIGVEGAGRSQLTLKYAAFDYSRERMKSKYVHPSSKNRSAQEQ